MAEIWSHKLKTLPGLEMDSVGASVTVVSDVLADSDDELIASVIK